VSGRRVLLRLLRGLAALALLLLVLRAVSLPLARQRQARRVESATLVALVPAGLERWCLERPALRRAPAALWPSDAGRLRERAAAWGLPIAALEADSVLTLTPFGGEWLCGRRADGTWQLIGARDRLRPSLAAAAGPAPLALAGGYALRLAGERFLLASSAALLAGPAWLAAQRPWLERDDLLLGADWLEFAASGAGGALLGAKWLPPGLLYEGLAWDCPGGAGEAALLALAPGPPPAAAPESTLLAQPQLRRSGPFDPPGRALTQVAAGVEAREDRLDAERRWRGESAAALARVLRLP
jgi:hypothetical protein